MSNFKKEILISTKALSVFCNLSEKIKRKNNKDISTTSEELIREIHFSKGGICARDALGNLSSVNMRQLTLFKFSFLTLTFIFLPGIINGTYETEDTIILEAPQAQEIPENPDSPGHKKFPFLVAIFKDGNNICSGALLSKLYVLSSAYCLQNISKEDILKYQIGIGFQSLGNDEKPLDDKLSEGPYYVRRVAKVIMDRGFYYESLKMHNSLLLLKMDTEVIFNDNVQPIYLSDNSTIPVHRRKHPLPPVRTAELAGWRKGNEVKGKDMVFLRGVTLRVYTYDECRKEYLNSYRMEDIICANIPTNNPCHFTLGSLLSTKRYGKQFLIGLRERDCHFPSVFTRVEYFIPWIRKNMLH